MGSDDSNTEHAFLTDDELDAMASLVGLQLPRGSHDGVRLHLLNARRMRMTLDMALDSAHVGESDGFEPAPVFRAGSDQ